MSPLRRLRRSRVGQEVSAKVKVKRREPEFRSADMLQSFSYVCRMFHFGSSHLFQHDFCEYEPNQNENETVGFVETNVETSDSDSDEFLSCDEGFEEVFGDFESENDEDSFLNSLGTTFCQENHGTSGHMDWEYHVGRTSSGQADRKCSCDGTFVDPCFRMMRGFPQVEDLTQDEDLEGPVLEPQDEGSSVGSPSLAATEDLVQPHEPHLPPRPDTLDQIENSDLEVEVPELKGQLQAQHEGHGHWPYDCGCNELCSSSRQDSCTSSQRQI